MLSNIHNTSDPTPTYTMAPTTLEVPARKRTVRACDQCRRRKVKCNGKLGCTECNSIGLECSYGSQIKQSRRRNYLIHLEQKVQRLEHELRSARSVTDRRPSDVSMELSNPHPQMQTAVQDYAHVNQEANATMVYWNNSYNQTAGNANGEWAVPPQPKPFLPQLLVPSQCVRSSDYANSHRADSLSPQSSSTATWTPCTGDVMDFWRPMVDPTCQQNISPIYPAEANRWMDGYTHTFDTHLDPNDIQPHHAGMTNFTPGNMPYIHHV